MIQTLERGTFVSHITMRYGEPEGRGCRSCLAAGQDRVRALLAEWRAGKGRVVFSNGSGCPR
jgi:hypothetical protein